ncbi:MAG: M81 family metallopeptidase [Rhodospirillales bacterium]|jgi:microcystin degradation protein MlrC|nr:M81 family metallopeptidase [Rhodospirillales bacterium]MBT4040051.1 M81 family metallopeptidase [Rhodospirillales bacterium]MBT4627346.1 M81 family metallopeptidase [Rhodospirillales bacterium]MBT5351110.1 M81 family metallopeptidase [Rhodospirillales bacterium]MBT5521610.1 M81 family metallopeptidase [Rhodospirillales bacterium]
MPLRAVIAMMEHETNTFSPVPTPLSRFGSPDVPVPTGQEVYRQFKGTGTGIGGFLDVADAEGMEIITPIAGNAAPSGKVDAQAYATMCDAICDAIAAGCDVCFLDLHGAMVAETTDDGEGSLLKRIRQLAPDLPIAVSFDLHANMTQDIVDNCTVLVGYKTYPHIDMYEAGEHAGRIMVRALKGEIRPVMAWGQRPILAQTLRMGHDDHPMGPMIGMARREEANGLLAANVFGGFPLADFHDAGLSIVTVADGDMASAEAACERMLSEAWRQKDEWVFTSEPLNETIANAKQLTEGPVILLDHADNSASGGTQDTMAVLKEVIDQGLEDVAMFGIFDPAAVTQMEAAGVGRDVTIDLGGKIDMPEIGMTREPLRVSGKVRAITDGDFVITVPMGRGTKTSMGKTAVLDTGQVQIVICSNHTEPYDLGCFRSVGIEPTAKRYLILKSRIHYRAGFRDIARHEIPCNGVGVTSSDNSLFTFKNIRRPIYPLDPECPERPNYEIPPV